MKMEMHGRKSCWKASASVDAIPVLRREVHLWRISLVRPPEDLRRLFTLLDSDERQRAARFHFANDREKFIAGRGGLRLILGRYLDEDPRTVCFSYGPSGKPEISGGDFDSKLRFNLSHSHELAVLAVTREQRVGIDLEVTGGDRLEPVEIADACFSPDEQRLVRQASSEERIDLFYRIWTRKEAILKGLGVGLNGLSDRFSISLGRRMVIPASSGDESESNWSVEEIRIAPNYVGAIAVEGDGVEISFHGTIDGNILVAAAPAFVSG